jgi:hypothetical protein
VDIPVVFTPIDESRLLKFTLVLTAVTISSLVRGGRSIVTFLPKNDVVPTLGDVKPNPFGEGKVTVVNPDVEKAVESMEVTLAGMVMDVKLDVPANELNPMLVTLDGMVMDVKLDAPSNAFVPMLVTPDGMVIAVKAVAFWKATTPMCLN